MIKNKRIFSTLIVILFLFVSSLMSQTIDDDAEAVSLFTKGKRLMSEGDYYEAAIVFEELEARFSNSANIDLFLFYRAKAKYYYAEYNESAAGFSYFTSRFVNSKYLAEAYFFLGNSYYRSSKVNQAVNAWLKAYQFSDSKSLTELSRSSLIASYKNASKITLTNADFEHLTADKKCPLVKELADIYIDRGDVRKANELLAECGEAVTANSQNGTIDRLTHKSLEIAMVLPMSGELQSYGEDIYNGAVIAAELFRAESGKEIQIVPYDTKGDPIEAAQIVSQLANSGTTDVVVGPLTSEAASVASASLICSTMPLIAPAANQAGLTRLSENAFQLAPNTELEGVRLAEYAIEQLKADTAAVISSTATENIRMTRAFKRRFEQLGGTVIAVEYYRSRDKDFGTYIRDIKGIILDHPADSTYYISPDGDTLDFELLPVYIDCIFMPGEPRQLRQLIPQVHFYNLNARYLGSNGWGDDAIYKLGDNVTKEAVFASPFIEGRNSDEFLKFSRAYDKRYGKQPQRLSSLGYDAVNLVLMSIQNGISRENIRTNLGTITNYIGSSGKISFGEKRENIEMPLYRIKNETVHSLSEEQIETATE